jgi:hypothetical protein
LEGIFAGKASRDGQPVLYICRNFACEAPAIGLEAIKSRLETLAAT